VKKSNPDALMLCRIHGSDLRDAFPHLDTRDDVALYIARRCIRRQGTAFAIASKSEAMGSIGLMPGLKPDVCT
jgi:hypothetical protein